MLADGDHPAIQARARELTTGRDTLRDQLESLFHFVRDDIRFGFPPTWDEVKASETLEYGVGYCNTKATLFLALCRAAGIGARLHTGLISSEILRGIVPAAVLPFFPREACHSWLDVESDGAWRPLDSYINDRRFYDGALRRLQASGRTTGLSLSLAKGPCSCEFNFGDLGFVHMGAVVEDHGFWRDFSDYMATPGYHRMTSVQLKAYPWLARRCNRAIEGIRMRA